MKKNLLLATLVVLVPSFAMAHVSVRPRESKSGAEEQYTVRIPTEGAVATTHVMLEIPADVTVLEVLPAEGATFETAKQGDHITSITWRKAIPPKASVEFAFRARNPAATEIAWKAHQHFSDGTVAHWVGAAGDGRPAAVTKLSASAGWPQTLLVLSSLPFAVAGSIWLLAFMHYNQSTAVWVGLIAVAGSCMFLTLLVLPAAYAMWRRHQVRTMLAVPLSGDITVTALNRA